MQGDPQGHGFTPGQLPAGMWLGVKYTLMVLITFLTLPLLPILCQNWKFPSASTEQCCFDKHARVLISIRFVFRRFNGTQATDLKTDYRIGFLRFLHIFWDIKSYILTKIESRFDDFLFDHLFTLEAVTSLPWLYALITLPLRAALSQSECSDPVNHQHRC